MHRSAIHGVVVLLAVISVAAWGQDTQPTDPYRADPSASAPQHMQGQATHDQAATGSFKPNLTEASKLMCAKVSSSSGEILGTIQDLVVDPVDPYDSRISFAVLAPSDGGESLYAVPWSLIATTPDKQTVTINVTKTQFENAPCFSRANWPDVTNSQWREQVYGHYKVEPAGQSVQWPGEKSDQITATERTERQHMASQQQMMGARKMSDLIGMDVKNPDGQDLGKIRDVVVDTQRGHIAYSILALPEAEGPQKLAVVPWSAVELSSRMQFARLNTDIKALQASTYSESDLSRLSNEQYARTIYDRFDREPYWEVYGYAPGQPAAGQSTALWAKDSPYNKQFNKDKIITVEGTIVSVGTFQPEANASPGLRLTIEAKDGRLFTVGAGPYAFAQKQNVAFSNGETVTVTGSEISTGTVMATKVKTDKHTLSLRDNDGEPKWSMSDLERSTTPTPR